MDSSRGNELYPLFGKDLEAYHNSFSKHVPHLFDEGTVRIELLRVLELDDSKVLQRHAIDSSSELSKQLLVSHVSEPITNILF